jgi:subtilisin family serine protease
MKGMIFLPGLLSFSLAASALSGHPQSQTDNHELKVLLQGSSAAAMAELINANGGTVTHHLPIIDAVGAKISRENLETVIKSPLVDRYLDDLSVSTEPVKNPQTEDDTCDVGGALELEVSSTDISWRLYNIEPKIAKLQSLEISWPKSMGRMIDLRLGAQPLVISETLAISSGNTLKLDYEETKYPQLEGMLELRATFEREKNTAEINPALQKDFSIEAIFTEDCTTKLIPGYLNNHENTYYPTVVGADALHSHGITGKGVTIAIIDSGLWEHPNLLKDTQGNSRVIARYDAIKDVRGNEVFDESGHGTHMASVLANSLPVTQNNEPTGSYKGVAPDVNLVAVKAFDIEGQGDFLDIIRAVQFVVDHREALQVKILNLSFAARPRWRYFLDPINQAIMKAWASGITVVAAAGNEGPDDMTIGSPGNLPYVITVGAVTDSWTLDTRDDDYIPDFSSRGPTPDGHIKPDIVAPGGHMTGITRPGSTLTKKHPDYFLRTGEFVMTGSSQASALVSGIAALLLQLEPDLSPDDIKCKLITSAEPAINRDGLLTYSPFQQGNGYVSATRAITLGQTGCGNAGMDIHKDISGEEHFEGPAIVDEAGNPSLPDLSEVLSPDIPEKNSGENRRWGAKAHVERPDYPSRLDQPLSPSSGFDWESIYLDEKTRIERLAKDPVKNEND